MKELFSIVFIIICGTFAYGIFSSESTASDSTSVLNPTVTPKIYQCAGSAITYTTGTPTTVAIACTGTVEGSAKLVLTTTSAQCATNQIAVGVTYTSTAGGQVCPSYGWGGASQYCGGCNAWGGHCDDCCHNDSGTVALVTSQSYSCYLTCVPLTITAPAATFCSWV